MTRRLLLIALLAGIPLGCLSKSYPERQRYVLDPGRSELPHVAAAAGASGAGEAPMGALRVGRVRVSPLFERKRFVYRTGDSTDQVDTARPGGKLAVGEEDLCSQGIPHRTPPHVVQRATVVRRPL